MRACVRTVGDRLAVKGHVEVAADKDLLALEVSLGEVANRLLGHLDVRDARNAGGGDLGGHSRGVAHGGLGAEGERDGLVKHDC